MAQFLMCQPDYFNISYKINPWMNPEAWHESDIYTAMKEWLDLRDALRAAGAEIFGLPPRPELPDMVFTANHGVVLGSKALLANFKCQERKPEQRYVFDAFAECHDMTVVAADAAGVVFEGAGDCIWDRNRNLFWFGYGQRSEKKALNVISNFFDKSVIGLELIDPRFYHLDTAFMVLPNGELLYYPGAFANQDFYFQHTIALSEEEACNFSANCIAIGDKIIISHCSTELERKLSGWGYKVIRTPLPTFHKSGGSAYCLTLRLDHAA